MLQEQELLSSSFPGWVFEAGVLVKAANTEFWGEEAWMGKEKGCHNAPVLMPECCWMSVHGYAAFQTLSLCLYLPGMP